MSEASIPVPATSGDVALSSEHSAGRRKKPRLRLSVKRKGDAEVSAVFSREQVAGLIFRLESWRRWTARR